MRNIRNNVGGADQKIWAGYETSSANRRQKTEKTRQSGQRSGFRKALSCLLCLLILVSNLLQPVAAMDLPISFDPDHPEKTIVLHRLEKETESDQNPPRDSEEETESETESDTGIETITEAMTEIGAETEAETGIELSDETEAETEPLVLVSEGADYRIVVTCGPDAGIPYDAELKVSEILPDKQDDAQNAHEQEKSYEEYVSDAENALDGKEKITFARFFDICIMKDGEEIQPAGPVSVRIELPEELTEDVKAVHFEKEETPEVSKDQQEPATIENPVLLDAEVTPAEEMENAVVFETGGFSVFGVFGTTIEKTVLARNGRNYRITVSYGPEAGIPEKAKLEVEEIEQNTETVDEKTNFETLLERTGETLGFGSDEFSYVRFFDIRIVDENGDKVEISAPVDVKIELADTEGGKDLSIVHFAESKDTDDADPERLDSITEGDAVSFQTDSFSVYAVVTVDPQTLGGKSYGLINTKDGSKPSGIAMMSAARDSNTRLQGKATTVRVNTVNRTDYVYVANNSTITMWTFQQASGGKYYITAKVGSNLKYLKVSANGVSLANSPDEECVFTVTKGTGTNAGKYKFSTGSGVLRLNGSNFERAGSTFNGADAWMNFADLSELNEDDFVTYTAQKVSISEAAGEVNDGDMVILYTRIWNESAHKYEYYIVDYDGKLVRAYESGDTISWVGSQINTMLWNFKEHYYEGTDQPNGYYDLQNISSDKFIAPRTSGDSEIFLSDNAVGINLRGRDNGDYYTTILAWDDYYYSSLKVDEENVRLLSSTLSQASDFYFAKMSSETSTMEVTTVSTLDNNQYGITVKMQDFGEDENVSSGRSKEMDGILGSTKYEQWTGTKNLLKKYIADGTDYPIATYSNKTLGELFDNPKVVNQQFLTNTYNETGYFEYDSTQNFAHLITSENDPWYGLSAPNGGTYGVGDFVIYGQLGTSSEGSKDTLRHGQFFPYNDIIQGFQKDKDGNYILDEDGNPIPIAIKISSKYANTMDIHADPLSSLDPAYGEALYEITYKNTHILPYVDHFFGMEMSAGFMQSADGVDAWGHDLIFEFSGDDDFWLYVDDVMVLDLGGIHSALDGSVNFRTGRIVENGKPYWLSERFADAYRQQHAGEADLEENLQTWLKTIFKVDTETGEVTNVFKDYSTHTMRMFYLERGAGASNIHMRFNISEYKEGQIQLEKKVSGTENSDKEFPFQIWYKDPHTYEMKRADSSISVTDSKTGAAVSYQEEYLVLDGETTLTYNDVFFLKAGQTVNIKLPDENTKYYIKECAIDSPKAYDWVKINDVETDGSPVAPQLFNDESVSTTTVNNESSLLDFNTSQAQVSERKKVTYENHVNENAMQSLTITKRLWQDEGRQHQIHSGTEEDADNTRFQFRVYIGMEDGKYTLYKNGPYHVKNPDGEYCYHYQGDFVSTGKKIFSDINDDLVGPGILRENETLQERCTFHTGQGSISKIKADYIVEIPGLMVGTPFIVLERDDEIPSGYDRLGYEINDSFSSGMDPREVPTEVSETSFLLKGEIANNQDVIVHNQHGFNLSVNKDWSDAAFMEYHDEIYFAVYKKDGGALSLIDTSVRQLRKTETSLSWFFPQLDEGKNLNDYEVYEVMFKIPEGSKLKTVEVDSSGKVTGYVTAAGDIETPHKVNENTIILIQEDGILTAGGKSSEQGYSESIEYTASYNRQVLYPDSEGSYPNTRTDIVANSRPGIRIVKTDMNDQPLQGAVFTFSNNSDPDPAKTKRFISDGNGLIAVAYLLPETDYTLKEISAPYGYRALIDQITIRVDLNGKVYVNGSETDPENRYYSISQELEPTADKMPTVKVRNKAFTLSAVKIDAYSNRPMEGVHFELYDEAFVTTDGVPDPNRPRPAYSPKEGYEDLVTDGYGVIPKIVLKNADNPDGLEEKHYYLKEKDAPPGYNSLEMYIRISISATGQVGIESAKPPKKPGEDWTIGSLSSEVAEIEQKDENSLQITVKNTPKDPVRIKKLDMNNQTRTLTGVKFELYKSSQIEGGKPKEGETPVASGETDGSGILNLGGLEGMYFLFETESLPGYILLSGAIQITSSADKDEVTAYLDGTPLNCRRVTDSEGKKVWEIIVYNSTGVELPATGGPGTGLIYLLGAVFLSLAGAGFILRKRRRTA